MLNATCYIVHFSIAGIRAQLSMQWKAWSAVYHSCPSLMLTHQSTGAGLQLKAWVDSPTGMWASLPRVPSHTATTLADIKGLLLFFYIWFSLHFSSHNREKDSSMKVHEMQQTLPYWSISTNALNYRSIRSIQLLRAQLEQKLKDESKNLDKKIFFFYVSLRRQIESDRDKNHKGESSASTELRSLKT